MAHRSADAVAMKRTALWLAALSFLSPAWAQDTGKPSPDRSQAKQDTPARVRLRELQAEQRQISIAWQQQMQAAAKAAEQTEAEGKPRPALRMRPDMSGLFAKYMAAAKEFPGDDAIQFLLASLNLGDGPDDTKQVLDILLTDHIKSPQLGQIGRMLGYLDRMVSPDYAKQAMAKIEQSNNPALLGWLAFARNEPTLRAEPAASKVFQDAKQQLLAAIDKVDDPMLKRQVESLINEQEKFGTGMVAPDIEGQDLDGVAFKLSDYKGKVVFLDFWGDW